MSADEYQQALTAVQSSAEYVALNEQREQAWQKFIAADHLAGSRSKAIALWNEAASYRRRMDAMTQTIRDAHESSEVTA